MANSTETHSQRATARMNPAGASPWPARAWAWAQSTVVRMLPTYSTNITGLRHWTAGVSFLNESMIAGFTSTGSNMASFLCDILFSFGSVRGPEHQLLDHRTERERGNVIQRADQHHGADQQHDEERAMGRHGAGAAGDALLRSAGAGQGQYRNDHAEAAEPHGNAVL